jgi:integrase
MAYTYGAGKVIHKLTGRTVQGAKPMDKPYEIRDTDLKGLMLRVQPSGVKSFVMEFGRGQRRTIGSAAVVTLEQARVTARHWLADRDKGKLPAPARGKNKPLTLGEFIEKKYQPWVESERKAGKATIAALKAQFEGLLYAKRLGDITAYQLDKFKSDRLKAKIAPATVNRDLDRIRAVLSKALEWGLIDVHPARTVKRVKGGEDSRVRFLTPPEEKALRKALTDRESDRRARRLSGNAWAAERGHHGRALWKKDDFTDHLSPLVLLALNTGMRRGELFGLSWADVDLCNKVITIRAATAKSQRTRRIPLNAEALDVLKRWKGEGTPAGLVFPGDEGRTMTNINRSWAAVVKEAGIANFRFHDCRHHFASRLVMSGSDLYTVKELLGHSDFEMTQRYAHLAPEHKAAAVARLDDARKKKTAAAR